jgi:hypothetical protein
MRRTRSLEMSFWEAVLPRCCGCREELGRRDAELAGVRREVRRSAGRSPVDAMGVDLGLMFLKFLSSSAQQESVRLACERRPAGTSAP